jgi:L-ascorbate metabolism protein UlaG (beta-lactamase superfamily)
VLAGVEMVLVSHLHPDHFDDRAQELLPKNIKIYSQPDDEGQIRAKGFSHVESVKVSVEWHGLRITRIPGQHGNEVWAGQMGTVAGFILRAE